MTTAATSRMPPATTAPWPPRLGQGHAEIGFVRGQSVVTRGRSTSPLKLLCPQHASPAAWIYASSFGGGLVAGDRLGITLRVASDAVGVLTTQAASKVYHKQDDAGCTQTLDASVDARGVLVVGPDPVTCFADARYEQRQTFGLHAAASLVVVDWITSGRAAMGERWAFDRYTSRNDIRVDGELVIRDAVRLDAADAALDGIYITGGYHCLATVLLVGPRWAQAGDDWLRKIRKTPLEKSPDVLAAASPLPGGVVLRLAGRRTQDIADRLQYELAFLKPTLGRGLWERKW